MTDPYGEDTTVIVRTVTRIVVPLILVTAVSLLLRGHNLPGGGFIAGVLTAVAGALLYVIFGLTYLETRVLDVNREAVSSVLDPPIVNYYRLMFALGLLLAAGSGLVAMAFDLPFLTQTFRKYKDVFLYGEFELASALAFDVGVYLVVVGALLTITAVVGAE